MLATNALYLDPHRLEPANGTHPAGNQRLALFAAAGMIEVTPESVRQWNEEVLAGHRRLIESASDRALPRWGDVMTKLLSFHLQGDRQNYETIAARCNEAVSSVRITLLLPNRRPPSESERLALYRYVGLDDNQVAYIEDGINSGIIPLGSFRQKTPFADALSPILDKLSTQGVSLRQLELRTKQLGVPGTSPVNQPDLSTWRNGKNRPGLAKLRSLIAVLRQFGAARMTNPVTPEEIEGLIAASGFHPRDLSDTTHQIIARIHDQTQIKPLLRALQSASDTCISADEVHRRGTELGYSLLSVPTLYRWEAASGDYPSGEQIRELLQTHKCLMRRNGFPPLSDEEIAKVVAVAERDYARWQSLSHAEKLTECRPSRPRRQPPSPSFDGRRLGR